MSLYFSLSHLRAINHRLNPAASWVLLHSIKVTIYHLLMATPIMHYDAPRPKAKVISNWFHEREDEQWLQRSLQSSGTVFIFSEHIWERKGPKPATWAWDDTNASSKPKEKKRKEWNQMKTLHYRMKAKPNLWQLLFLVELCKISSAGFL